MRKTLVEGVRFAEDIRYFQFLRNKDFVRKVSDRFIDEVSDVTVEPDFLNNSLRVTQTIAPDFYRLLEKTKEGLGLTANVDLYIRKGGEINAYVLRQAKSQYVICLTGSLVEHMSTSEIEFVLGHELGHAIYDHHILPVRRVISETENPNLADIEDLMRWSRMAEISADRAGLIACNDINAAIGAMLVLTTGVSTSALNVNFESYANHARELIGSLSESPDLEDFYSTHPFNPLRIVALNSFWDFWKNSILEKQFIAKNISEVDQEIRSILEKMEGEITLSSKVPEPERQYESKQSSIADPSSRVLFWGAICVACADGDFSELEIQTIMQWLFDADVVVEINRLKLQPEILDYSFSQFESYLPSVIKTPVTNRCSILQKLVLVARADGVVCDKERHMLIKLSMSLDISPNFYEKILKYL